MNAVPLRKALLLGWLVAVIAASSVTADTSTVTANVRVVGVNVVLTVPTATVAVGDKVKVQANVSNTGPARLPVVTVELRLPASGIVVKGATVVTLTRLQPGKTASASWTICGTQPGNYLLLARVTVDGAVVESAAHVLTVSAQSRRRAC